MRYCNIDTVVFYESAGIDCRVDRRKEGEDKSTGELQIGVRECRRAHFGFTNPFATVALEIPAARSGSLRDSTAVTARRLLSYASTGSCPRNPHAMRKRLVYDVMQ